MISKTGHQKGHNRSTIDARMRPGGHQRSVERLNEHSLEDYLGGQRTTAKYIVDGWDAGTVLVSTRSQSLMSRDQPETNEKSFHP